jgi:two-component system phosphate regulon sensor histidine kinase PhoR
LFLTYGGLVVISLALLGWIVRHRLETHLGTESQDPLSIKPVLVRDLEQTLWTTLAASLLATLMFSLFLARRFSAPLVELAAAARALARGAHGQHVPVWSADEIGALATAFNEMSKALGTQIAQMDQDRQQLRAIFKSMDEGVLVLDAQQHVQFLNESAGRLLNLSVDFAQGRRLWQLIRHRQLGMAVERILTTDEPHRCEIEWNTGERRVLAVHGTRLPGRPVGGAVLVLHDLSHLRQLEQVRQDFVANVSHELKTPLAAIQAVVETLLDGALHDTENNVRFLERIRENAERLHRLVLDLLTLSRIESGQEAMDVQPISVQGAVRACTARLEQRALAKKLRLETAPPPEPLAVLADEEALADILDNLVDNAIKYTPAGGQVTLRWFPDEKDAVLQVEDTGIGIPEKDLPRIFERFYRVDRARSRELGGTGLGLSIVKHLVQALGGSIKATSQPGSGSTFTLRIPLAELATFQEAPEGEAANSIESELNLH